MTTLLDFFNQKFTTTIKPADNIFASVLDNFTQCITREHTKICARGYQQLYLLSFSKNLQYTEALNLLAKANGFSDYKKFATSIKKTKNAEIDVLCEKLKNDLAPPPQVESTKQKPKTKFEKVINSWLVADPDHYCCFKCKVSEIAEGTALFLDENKFRCNADLDASITYQFAMYAIASQYLNETDKTLYKIADEFSKHLYTEPMSITLPIDHFACWLEMPKFIQSMFSIDAAIIYIHEDTMISALFRSNGKVSLLRTAKINEYIEKNTDFLFKHPEIEFILKCTKYIITGEPKLTRISDPKPTNIAAGQKEDYDESEIKVNRVSYNYEVKERIYTVEKWSRTSFINKHGTLVEFKNGCKRNQKLLKKLS